MRRAHRMPFGAEFVDDGVRFALWAPTAKQVALVLDGTAHALKNDNGWYRTVRRARSGSRYGFRIDGDLLVPDPASRFQPDDVHRESMVVDPRAYRWEHDGWKGRPWEETVLYEVHVGTATPEGTYAGLEKKLEELRDLGVTAIELLPLAEFPGKRNWGYDGVLPFAPDAAYGTPEDLKRLVDRAHGLGLMIFIDAVYNHFGPSGNYLHAYAKEFFNKDYETPWGAAINFANPNGRDAVRDFFVHNALYWLNEINVDGLRFDAVHAFKDDSRPHFIEELARRIRDSVEPGREIHLVLENEANEARWLNRDGSGRPILHTAQWADDIHNCWHPILTGESEGYYESFADKPVERLGRALAEGFAFQGDISKHHGTPRGEPSAHLPPTAFVSFLQNHDQVGNRAFGERLSDLVEPGRLSLARALFLLSPQIPLLFQGEDWAATSPFLFFVDFESEPELEKAVREGRRREFSHFAAFADPDANARIPDPTARDTFERSRIDWSETGREPHAAVRKETAELLRLRREEIVPLLQLSFGGGTYALPNSQSLDVRWRFGAGSLRLLANFGDAAQSFRAEGLRAIWTSREARREADALQLPPWTGAILKGETR